LTVVSLSFPSLSEAVLGVPMNNDNMLMSSIISKVAALGAAALFVRECRSRTLQLLRFERELNAESLMVRLPPSTPFATSRPTSTFQQLRGKKRILVLAGNKSSLQTVLPLCFALGQRLKQSNTIVVPVLTNVNNNNDTNNNNNNNNKNLLSSIMSDNNIENLRRQPWFAEPIEAQEWKTYLNTLLDDDEAEESDNLRWFGLNYNGRSFASGRQTSSFRLLEIMGQNLRPTDILDLEPSNDNTGKEPTLLMTNKNDGTNDDNDLLRKTLLDLQSKFYEALTGGNLPVIQDIFAGDPPKPFESLEVSEILELGGRMDIWSMCLEEDARPANMLTSNPDVCLVSETMAFTTIMEFPSVGGSGDSYSSGNIGNPSLLAIQRWTRQSSDDSDWKLELHQTIPWNPDTKAGGTLRCDGRGCVALTRGNDKRTFGGLVG